MQEYIARFQEYITRNRMKWTQQRLAVLEALWSADDHVTSEQLAKQLAGQGKRVGLATVYRNLKLLVDAGLARELHLGDQIVRYERNDGKAHHDHLICEQCAETIEFYDDDIESLQEELAATHGFSLTGHRMYLYGLCAKCRKQE